LEHIDGVAKTIKDSQCQLTDEIWSKLVSWQ